MSAVSFVCPVCTMTIRSDPGRWQPRVRVEPIDPNVEVQYAHEACAGQQRLDLEEETDATRAPC